MSIANVQIAIDAQAEIECPASIPSSPGYTALKKWPECFARPGQAGQNPDHGSRSGTVGRKPTSEQRTIRLRGGETAVRNGVMYGAATA